MLPLYRMLNSGFEVYLIIDMTCRHVYLDIILVLRVATFHVYTCTLFQEKCQFINTRVRWFCSVFHREQSVG